VGESLCFIVEYGGTGSIPRLEWSSGLALQHWAKLPHIRLDCSHRSRVRRRAIRLRIGGDALCHSGGRRVSGGAEERDERSNVPGNQMSHGQIPRVAPVESHRLAGRHRSHFSAGRCTHHGLGDCVYTKRGGMWQPWTRRMGPSRAEPSVAAPSR